MNLNRRKFLQSTGTLVLGGMALSGKAASLFDFAAPRPVGLQLYTLFDVIDSDVRGTLQQVAAIGYKEIESAFSKKGWYYGMSPKNFKAMVSDLGMSWKSHHVL